MADKKQKHKRDALLKLTRRQLVALATQKRVAHYRNARTKTKGQLVALMCDIEGVLTPVKTWDEDGDMLDNDQRVIEELAGTEPGTVEVA